MSHANANTDTGWIEHLQDGTRLRIRPIARRDAELELEFLAHLSPEFRNARFLGLVHDPSPEVARKLTDIDPTNTVAFIALVSHGGKDRQVGAAQFHAAGDSCDASLTVGGEWRRRGVGSALMRHLIDAARARGIRHMRAYAPVPSGGSDSLASSIGFRRRVDPDDPVAIIYDLPLD